LGEVAEETEEESYDLVEGFGDLGKGLFVDDEAAMVMKPWAPIAGVPLRELWSMAHRVPQ
jgi:hypothetical protein